MCLQDATNENKENSILLLLLLFVAKTQKRGGIGSDAIAKVISTHLFNFNDYHDQIIKIKKATAAKECKKKEKKEQSFVIKKYSL